MLVAGLASGVVVVLEPDTLQKRRTFNVIKRDIGSEYTPFIDRSIVSQNGRILIRKNSHTSFGSWDLVTGIFIQHFNSYGFKLGEIGPISLSADGTQAATAHRSRYHGGDGHIAIWDIETGSLLHAVENYLKPPMDILFSPDGLFLICSDEGGECTELCLNGLKFSTRHIHTGQFDASPMSALGWHPGSKYFLCGHHNGSIITVESAGSDRETSETTRIKTPKCNFSFTHLGDMVDSLALSSDGLTLAVAGGRFLQDGYDTGDETDNKGFVAIYENGNKNPRWKCWIESHVFSVSFSEGNKSLVSGGVDGICCLWDVSDGTILKQISLDSSIISISFVVDVEDQQQRRLAFAMGSNSRLGDKSILSILPEDLFKKLLVLV